MTQSWQTGFLRDDATGALVLSDPGAAQYATAGTFTAQQFIQPTSLQPGTMALQIASPGGALNVSQTVDHSSVTNNPVDSMDIFHASTGDAVFVVDRGGELPASFSFTANTASGSPTLAAVSNYTGLMAGTPITGAGIPGGTTVLTTPTAGQVAAGQLTMSQNASATAAGVTVTVTKPAGTAGGDAAFNALIPYYLDDISTGYAGQIVNNRLGMAGLFIQSQATQNTRPPVVINNQAGAPAISVLNWDPAHPVPGSGTGGVLVATDSSPGYGIRVVKNTAPGTGFAVLSLANTTASPVPAIRIDDTASFTARVQVNSDGQSWFGNPALNYTSRFIIDKPGTGLTEQLMLANSHDATNDGGIIVFAGNSAGRFAQIAATFLGSGNGKIELKPYVTGVATTRIAADNTGIGFFGATPVAKPTLAAASTDLASVITLANDLRTRLINYGLGA